MAVALDGIVHSARLTLQSVDPPAGTSAKIPVTVVLEDASGAIIVGSAPFESPLALSSSDAAAGPLSKTVLRAPADEAGITADYNGAKVARITYSASGSGLAASNVTSAVLTPATTSGASKIYVANGGVGVQTPGGTPVPGSIATYNADGTQTAPTITAGIAFPVGIAVDASGKIYVANESNAVTTYKPDGTQTTPTITALQGNPAGVAVDAEGKIYVTDSDGGDLSTFKADGTPTAPTILGGFFWPEGVAVDAGGKIYVAQFARGSYGSVITYTAEGNETVPDIGFGPNAPYAVAVDAAGKIYVAVEFTDTLLTYNANGTPSSPTITLGLNRPMGVAVDAAGKIYVANYNAHTVTTYNPDGTPSVPTISTGLQFPVGVAVH